MKELTIKLKVWRQKNSKDKGRFVDYDVPGLNEHMSFLEMLDVLNERLISFEEDDIFVDISLAEGDKCQRCWTILPEVKDNHNHLCSRCDNVWKSSQ